MPPEPEPAPDELDAATTAAAPQEEEDWPTLPGDPMELWAETGELPDPFLISTVPRAGNAQTPRLPPDEEAQVFAETYIRMLDSVVEMQSELEKDQEMLALMLQRAQTTLPPNEELDTAIFLLHEGLELRLQELTEECRRLAATQRRLGYALDDGEAACEMEALEASGLVDPKLTARVAEQRSVIQLQREELEQMCFERDVLANDAARLREEAQVQVGGDDDLGGQDVLTSADIAERELAAAAAAAAAAAEGDQLHEPLPPGQQPPADSLGVLPQSRPPPPLPPPAPESPLPSSRPTPLLTQDAAITTPPAPRVEAEARQNPLLRRPPPRVAPTATTPRRRSSAQRRAFQFLGSDGP